VCTVYWYQCALYIGISVHCILVSVCTVYWYKCALYIGISVHCILVPVCTVYWYQCALYIGTSVHCILVSVCTVYWYQCALYIGISVHCILVSLNTNYTPWRINWHSLLQILLGGSLLPPHTGVLLFTIGLLTLPFSMTREVQDKASFCLEIICRNSEL
jgi:hypothetical protein